MSSFLDRFAGRTQTVSKLGIEQLLKDRPETLIYTNTHKSFARSSTHQLRPQKPRLITPSEQERRSQEEPAFHLPHLGQRYLNNQCRRLEEVPAQGHSRMRIDRQTNWLVEEPEPLRRPSRDIAALSSVEAPKEKENLTRTQAQQEERRLGSHHFQQSASRSGGLGPNIGGEQWTAKREKQQKAKRYAEEVKRIQRQKMAKESGSSGNLGTNRPVINY